MTPEQEQVFAENLSKTQNVLNDLSDNSMKACVVVALKQDGSLVTASHGALAEVCLLTNIAKMLSNSMVAQLFNEE